MRRADRDAEEEESEDPSAREVSADSHGTATITEAAPEDKLTNVDGDPIGIELVPDGSKSSELMSMIGIAIATNERGCRTHSTPYG